MCIHECLQVLHLIKFLKIGKWLQRIFSNVYSGLFLKSIPKSFFETSRTTLKIFFQRCIHDSFQSLHLKKISKQVEHLQRIFFQMFFKVRTQKNFQNKLNNFKEFFFQMCIQDYLRHIHLGKSSKIAKRLQKKKIECVFMTLFKVCTQ